MWTEWSREVRPVPKNINVRPTQPVTSFTDGHSYIKKILYHWYVMVVYFHILETLWINIVNLSTQIFHNLFTLN